jgi:hypothetical protein
VSTRSSRSCNIDRIWPPAWGSSVNLPATTSSRIVATVAVISATFSVPPPPETAAAATSMIDADVAELCSMTDLLTGDDYAVRLVVDTNTLLDNPDLAAHVTTLGNRYSAHR